MARRLAVPTAVDGTTWSMTRPACVAEKPQKAQSQPRNGEDRKPVEGRFSLHRLGDNGRNRAAPLPCQARTDRSIRQAGRS